MIRLSCVQSCIYPDYRAFKVTYVQTIVLSKLHMSRLSCVQNCLSPDYRAFKIACVQIIVRSNLHMCRLSCVHFFPDRVILNARHPLCAFVSVLTYRLLVWYLKLGSHILESCQINSLNSGAVNFLFLINCLFLASFT